MASVFREQILVLYHMYIRTLLSCVAEAERRLKQFFPTADRETVVSVMRSNRSESKAVKRMIELGYPLKKVPLPRS